MIPHGIAFNGHITSRDSAGFTLLELIVVIFLISLILGLSTVFFSRALPSNRLNAAAREISATIRYARSLAQIHGEDRIVSLDLDSKSYGIEGRGTKNIPADIAIKVIDPLEGEMGSGKYRIVLNGSGGIEGGAIVLSQDQRSLRIEPDPVVGSVVIK